MNTLPFLTNLINYDTLGEKVTKWLEGLTYSSVGGLLKAFTTVGKRDTVISSKMLEDGRTEEAK